MTRTKTAGIGGLVTLVAAGGLLAGAFPSGARAAGGAEGTTVPSVSFPDGKTAFKHLHAVATHPRCVNCHGAMVGGRHVPLVGDAMRPHPMNVSVQILALGYKCTSCHQKQNLPAPGSPPGAANDRMPGFLWQPPPATMIIKPGITQRELCELWTDPVRNAGQTGTRGGLGDLPKFRKEFMHHVEDDPLIHWAFAPGNGRTPAPGNRETLVGAMDAWIRWLEAGNTCAGLPN